MQLEITSKNEREILKLLLDNGRMTDIEISNHLSISPQAIGKIRKKLENKGIIKGYSCILDFEKIGLKTFAFVYLTFSTRVYEFGGLDIFDKMKEKLEYLMCCIPSNSEVSFIGLLGFRNMSEMDRFFKKFKFDNREYCTINKIIPFSYDNLINFNSNNLVKRIIDGAVNEPKTVNDFK